MALIEQYLPNISDPVYSVQQSFMWFLWLNWIHILSRHCSEWFEMLTYCDVIDTRAERQQLWRHNDRLFPRGCYGRFLSTMMLRTVNLLNLYFVTPVFQHGASLVMSKCKSLGYRKMGKITIYICVVVSAFGTTKMFTRLIVIIFLINLFCVSSLRDTHNSK